MNSYKVLNKQTFTTGEYSLVPIRMEDRYDIMRWRNEQMYHLRQSETLTKEKQDWYFTNIVGKLFKEEKPQQILFSFLQNNKCIGYGGLVHINWINSNAEISFLLNTKNNHKEPYLKLFEIYLKLIEQVAINCELHKIYTYGYDYANYRFEPLELRGYTKEAQLIDHVVVYGNFCNVRIYSKYLNRLWKN